MKTVGEILEKIEMEIREAHEGLEAYNNQDLENIQAHRLLIYTFRALKKWIVEENEDE